MGNHGFITLKKEISMSDLFEKTNEIIKNRFGNKIYAETIVEGPDLVVNKPHESLCVLIKRKDGTEDQATCLWLTDKDGKEIDVIGKSKHIEFRHPFEDPMWWIELILTNQIAHAFNGKMSDDGTEGKWEPNTDKYKTYRDWAEHWNRKARRPSWLERHIVNKKIKEIVKIYGDLFADEKEEMACGCTGVPVE